MQKKKHAVVRHYKYKYAVVHTSNREKSLTFNVELVELVNGDLEVVVKVVEVQKEVWKRAR